MKDRIAALPARLSWLVRSMDDIENTHTLREQYEEGARVFVHLMRYDRPDNLAESYRGFGVDVESAWDDALRHMAETSPDYDTPTGDVRN